MIPTFKGTCDIVTLDQISGNPQVVIEGLLVNGPYQYNFRQTRAETAYDFTPMEAYSAVPDINIEEGWRMVFPTGESYRIHSVNKWPGVNPSYLQFVLQGDGDGYQ